MEAANRGASEAGGRTVGLNIGLPYEQRPNLYVSHDLCFEFHYLFMRKLWLAHLARTGALEQSDDTLFDLYQTSARTSRISWP